MSLTIIFIQTHPISQEIGFNVNVIIESDVCTKVKIKKIKSHLPMTFDTLIFRNGEAAAF